MSSSSSKSRCSTSSSSSEQELIHDVPNEDLFPSGGLDPEVSNCEKSNLLLLNSQLFSVIPTDNVKLLDDMYKKGRSLNITDHTGNTLLHYACKFNKLAIFNYLIRLDDIQFNAENHEYVRPLQFALMSRNKYFVDKLLEVGAELTFINNSLDANTALHYAIKQKDAELVKFVLNFEFDINCLNNLGQTALYVLCMLDFNENCLEMVQFLLCEGANPSIRSPKTDLTCLGRVLLKQCNSDLENLLYNYEFDPYSTSFALNDLLLLMAIKPTVAKEVLDQVSFIEFNFIRNLNVTLLVAIFGNCNANGFRQMIEKFPLAALDVTNSMYHCINARNNKIEQNVLYGIFETAFCVCKATESWSLLTNIFFRLYCINTSYEEISKMVHVIFSYDWLLKDGQIDLIQILFYDFGFCDLLEFVLIVIDFSRETWQCYDTFLNLIVNSKMVCNLQTLNLGNHNYLLKYFSTQTLKTKIEFKENNIPIPPSLLELTRDTVREHILLNNILKTYRDFYYFLRKHNVPKVYRDIILYKKAIYSNQC